MGNLLNVDRIAISVGGRLAAGDVDFYSFDIRYLDRNGFAVHPGGGTYETVLDIDWANGVDNRPNTSIHLFDATGRLIYTSRDSNIADDRPSRPGTADITALEAGSVGTRDPFLGVIDLAAGTTYTVAIAADTQMPSQMNQYFQANADNPDFRLEPIESVRRVAEDHLDFIGPDTQSTADPPQVSELLDLNPVPVPVNLGDVEFTAEVPYNLGDVVLFLSESSGLATTVTTVDPFTGTPETNVGTFLRETGDIAMHPEGWLYSYRLSRNEPVICSPRDDLSGNFLSIDPSNAFPSGVQIVTDDGIEAYQRDPTDPLASIRTNPCLPPNGPREGDGIEFNAITFGPTLPVHDPYSPLITGYAVGDRGYIYNPLYPDPNLMPGVQSVENILYTFVGANDSPDFGEANSGPYQDRDDDPALGEFIYQGAGTNIRERGELLTSPRLEAIYATGSQLRTPPGSPALQDIEDGQSFTVVLGADRQTFEFDTGIEVVQNIQINPSGTETIRDGNFFILDDNIFQLDTGSSVDIFGNGSQVDGLVVTVTDVLGNTFSYEFQVDQDPQPPPSSAVATIIEVGPAENPAQIARLLADAINADPFLDPFTGSRSLNASSPDSRVSLEGDFGVQVTTRR